MAESLPPRSIVVLSGDIPESSVAKLATRLVDILELKAVASAEVSQPLIRIYPRLRALVLPASAAELSTIPLVGNFGVIAVSDERVSIAPPGKEPNATMESLRNHSRAVRGADPLDATGVLKSKLSGDGELVMVLDVGFFAQHPDFVKRHPPITVHSFTGKQFPDPGHGTRSVGLACGPLKPWKGRRYGVAHKAEIFVGLVKDSSGIPDSAVLDGLEEAIKLQAAVVNLSFGATVDVDEQYSAAFEIVAQRALAAGVLVVAAAGNDQPNAEDPVNHPANCPSVL